MTRPDIEAMELLADKATQGPWWTSQAWLTHPSGYNLETFQGVAIAADCCGYKGAIPAQEDAEFIAAARAFIPEVCVYVRELERHLRLAVIALDRVVNDNGRRHPLSELVAELRTTNEA